MTLPQERYPGSLFAKENQTGNSLFLLLSLLPLLPQAPEPDVSPEENGQHHLFCGY
jgi:hypothetical protein